MISALHYALMKAAVIAVVLAFFFSAAADAKVAAPVEGTAVGQQLPAFKAATTILAGKKIKAGTWRSRKTRRPTVYMVVGTECPTTKAYMPRAHDLEQAYAAKVDFVFVYPNNNDTTDEKRAFHAAEQLAGPLIDDQGAAIAKALGAHKTSEIVIADKRGVVLYRGAIDDSKDAAKVAKRYVATALDEHLSGKAVTTTVSDVQA
jgi:thiol-disulfide isomerase/thioredoxin